MDYQFLQKTPLFCDSSIDEIKSMLLEIMNNSSTPTSNANLDTSIIDEILNM